MNIYIFIGYCIAAYLLGAIPFGLIYARIRGVDIREIGSGNIGATNIGRKFGFWGGFLPVFLFDAVKGATPVIVLRLIGVSGFENSPVMNELFLIIVGLLTILGNMFPVYLKFKGGKGVATSAGTFLAIAPLHTAIALTIFVIIYIIKKQVAPASIIAAFSLPFIFGLLDFPFETLGLPAFIVSILAAVLVIVRHKTNIQQMLEKKKVKKKES